MELITENTKVVIQGMTGKEGQKGLKAMLNTGTTVVAGVTPKKGGQNLEGVPVFNTIKEALDHEPKINTSVSYVPPMLVKGAAMEALEAGIKLLVIFAENVPLKDAAILIAEAEKRGARIVGPSSVGVYTIGKGCLGSLGLDARMFSPGNVGIISKSGGMCSETALLLTQKGIGQSTIIGIGGDVLIGTTFTDLMEMFEKDENTNSVVMYGEIGGTYEDEAAEMVKSGKFTKPLVAFVAGKFAESIAQSHAFGHAGAIIEGGKGKAEDKKKRLKSAGVLVADYHDDIPKLVKEALNGIQN